MYEFHLRCRWGSLVRFEFTIFQRWFRYWLGLQGLALLMPSWDKNWDSHSLVNGYPSFYPRIALVAPCPGDITPAPHTSAIFVTRSVLISSYEKTTRFVCQTRRHGIGRHCVCNGKGTRFECSPNAYSTLEFVGAILQSPVDHLAEMRGFYMFFVVSLSNLSNKLWNCLWNETPLWSYDVSVIDLSIITVKVVPDDRLALATVKMNRVAGDVKHKTKQPVAPFTNIV